MDLPDELVIGDDYLVANGRAITWTLPVVAGVTVGTAICKLGISNGTTTVVLDGTVATASTTDWTYTVPIARTSLASFSECLVEWSLELRDIPNSTEITVTQNEVGEFLLLRDKQT